MVKKNRLGHKEAETREQVFISDRTREKTLSERTKRIAQIRNVKLLFYNTITIHCIFICYHDVHELSIQILELPELYIHLNHVSSTLGSDIAILVPYSPFSRIVLGP